MTDWLFDPLLWWAVAVAVLVFWGVGAHNRLMRLRTKVLSIYASMATQFERYAAWTAEHAPELPEGGGPPRAGDAWSNLRAASAQFSASLTAVRGQPMDGPAMAGLVAARAVLMMAWQYLDDETLARARSGQAAPVLRGEWEAITAQAQAAEKAFGAAVDLHNQAIGQFPAVLLAWVFGFKRARRL